MIGDFLRRDFLDFRLHWIGLFVVTVLWVTGSNKVLGESKWEYLLLGYFLFGVLPQNFILGSPWRSQHQMSRHFLLALPIEHKTLFLIQNIRLLIFWLPAFAFGSLMPFLASPRFDHFTGFSWILFYLGLVVSFGLVEQLGIWTMLEWERLTSYLQPPKRLMVYLKIFGVTFGGIAVLSWAWTDLFLSNYPFYFYIPSQFHQLFSTIPFSQIVFPVGFLILGFWVTHNARRWCVSL